MTSPINEGRYRLFVFVDDGEKTAYMNIPFYVQSSLDIKSSRIRLKTQELEEYE